MNQNFDWLYNLFRDFLKQKRLFLIFGIPFAIYSFMPQSTALSIGVNGFRDNYLDLLRTITFLLISVYVCLLISDTYLNVKKRRQGLPPRKDIPDYLRKLSTAEKLVLRVFNSQGERIHRFESSNPGIAELVNKKILILSKQVDSSTAAYRISESDFLFIRAYPKVLY